MTTEAFTPATQYTVAGIGPYAIPHPYAQSAILAFVVINGERVALTAGDFSLTPVEAPLQGDLFLTPAAATTHAGRSLIIDRQTPDEQGWLGINGEREKGLEVQLDRIVQALQEIRASGSGALRIRGALQPFDWTDGTVPLRQGSRVVSGPTAAAIAAAQTRAIEAAASAAAAAASAAAALAKENSMVRQRGAWGTGILYSPSDQYTFGGELYGTLTAHFGTTVAADLAAGRVIKLVEKGAAGPGTGDMLKTDNLSGLASYPSARANLGLGALATKAQAAFADLDPAAVITDVETLAANKVANALPTAKAVTDYVDPRLGWTPYASGALSGTGPTVTGLGNFDSILIVILDVTLSLAARRQLRVGHSGGILSSPIYWSGNGTYSEAYLTLSAATVRAATLEIHRFNKTDAIKPVIVSGSASDFPLIAIETPLSLDRIQFFAPATYTGGTYHVYGRS